MLRTCETLLQTTLLAFQVSAPLPHLLGTAVGYGAESLEEALDRGVDIVTVGKDPVKVLLALHPLVELRTHDRLVSRFHFKLIPGVDQVPDFGENFADIVVSVCDTVASLEVQEGAGLLATEVLVKFRATRNAIATLFTHGVDEVIETLDILRVAEILNLPEANGVAVLVRVGVRLEVLLAFRSRDVVDRPTVLEITIGLRTLQAAIGT